MLIRCKDSTLMCEQVGKTSPIVRKMVCTVFGCGLSFFLLTIQALLPTTWGYGLGACPRIGFMPNFNISQFSGKWYEIERSFYLMELVASCVSVEIEEKRPEQLEVYVSSRSRVSGYFSISEGTAIPSKKDPSLLVYRVSSRLPRFLSRYLPGAGSYQVLRTDYTGYALLYSCSNFHLFHTDLVWVLARTKEIDVELRASIYQILIRNHIDPERLTLPKNKNCTDDY